MFNLYCYQCGNEINEKSKFCAKCGSKTSQSNCSKCGEIIIPNLQKFCIKCGAKISSDKEYTIEQWLETLNEFFLQYFDWHKEYIIFPQQLLEEPSNLKYLEKAKNQFMIPEYETIYMIYNDSILKNAKKGIIITEYGIYCNSGKVLKKFGWKDFANIRIVNQNKHLYFEKFSFNITDEDDLEKTFEVLISLQAKVKQWSL